MAQLCTHMPHLDLVDIGQNMSTIVRLMGTPNPMKKCSNPSMLQPQNPKICFHPSKNFSILTLHTHRQSLDWPLISILTSQPIHKACSGPWKTSHMFSIYEKTVNRKTSQMVSFFWIFTKPSQIDWHLHANLWVKIPNIHCSRISGLFRNVENSQKVST